MAKINIEEPKCKEWFEPDELDAVRASLLAFHAYARWSLKIRALPNFENQQTLAKKIRDSERAMKKLGITVAEMEESDRTFAGKD